MRTPKSAAEQASEVLAFFVLWDIDNALVIERKILDQLRQGSTVACPGDDIGFRDGGGLPREGLRVAAGEHHDGAAYFPDGSGGWPGGSCGRLRR